MLSSRTIYCYKDPIKLQSIDDEETAGGAEDTFSFDLFGGARWVHNLETGMATMVSHHGHHHPHSHQQYSCSPSDFDLLRALTSSTGLASSSIQQQLPRRNGNAAGKVRAGGEGASAMKTRRPQMDPLILETAASSGPHVTRNHFLHEFYPHPEDPSSSFSHHPQYHRANIKKTDPRSAASAYSSCDIGPEDEDVLDSQNQTGSPSTSSAAVPRVDTNGPYPIAVESIEEKKDRLSPIPSPPVFSRYQSRQAPRRIRLERERLENEQLEKEVLKDTLALNGQASGNDNALSTSPRESLHRNLKDVDPSTKLNASIPQKARRRSSLVHPDPIELPKILKASRSPPPVPAAQLPPISSKATLSPGAAALIPQQSAKPPLAVLCHARTRVPTPHGEVFIHLYKNNWDDKEHLAFVFDRQQLEQNPLAEPTDGQDGNQNGASEENAVRGTLRSKTLDAVWRDGETDMERIVRGAYVGRLSSSSAVPSSGPSTSQGQPATEIEPVLIRVHSECFTGETIGSQRCDCGEQLDEAFRLISTSPSGLGIIVYLRQEGRGIGLLEKIKAYNLQDLGHDTVTANLLLGHSADMRSYGIAGEILRDLGVDKVKLLTNNPDKIDSVEKEGIKVVERVPMVPRGWAVPTLPETKHRKSRKSKAKSKKGTKSRLSSGVRRDKSTLAGRFGGHLDPDGIASTAQSSASASEVEDEVEPDWYRGSNDENDEDESSDEDTDSSNAAADYLIAMNRTGVGMIGAGTTHSVELEKYLKTKIERMGHMLAVPSTPPSTPEPLRRINQKKIKSKDVGALSESATPTFSKRKVGKSRLEDSVTSLLQTDPESVNCEDCSVCGAEETGLSLEEELDNDRQAVSPDLTS